MRSSKVFGFLLAIILLAACQSEPKIEDYSGLWAIDVDKTAIAMNKPKEKIESKTSRIFSVDFSKKLFAKMHSDGSPRQGKSFNLKKQDAGKYLLSDGSGETALLEIINKNEIIVSGGTDDDKMIIHFYKISDTPVFRE